MSLDNVDNQLKAPPLRCVFNRVILSPCQWIYQQPIIKENVKVNTNLSLCSETDFSCNFNQAVKEDGETLQLTAATAGAGENTQYGTFFDISMTVILQKR